MPSKRALDPALDAAAQPYAEVARRLHVEAALREASAVICSTLDLPTVLHHIAEQMGRMADATSAYLYSYDRAALTVTVVAEYIGPAACEPEQANDLGTVYTVAASNSAHTDLFRLGDTGVRHLYADDTQLDAELRDHLRTYGAQTVLEVPLLVGGEVIAYASLWESRHRRVFSAEDIEVCQVLARNAAIAIQNARLYTQMQQELARRVHAEADLRALTERYQLIAEHTSDLICVLDTRAHFVYASPSFQRVLGHELAALIGSYAFALVHPDDYALVLARFALLATQGNVQAVFRYHHHDGSWRWFETLGSAVEQHGSMYVVIVGRDVTERLALEKRLLQTQKMESIGYLAGVIAHDFNNLLSVTLGYVGLLQRELPSDAPAQTSLQQIELATRQASDLTRQLLAYAGQGRIMLVPCNLNQIIREVGVLLHASIAPEIALHEQLAPTLPTLEGDMTQMRQMMMNLILNAIEAIGAAGSITITTGTRWCARNTLADLDVGADNGEGLYVVLEIVDTGCGIDAPTRAKIFDPFYTTKLSGRGLGLAAVLGIVRGHCGAIAVASAPGAGTTFTVWLPTQPAEAG